MPIICRSPVPLLGPEVRSQLRPRRPGLAIPHPVERRLTLPCQDIHDVSVLKLVHERNVLPVDFHPMHVQPDLCVYLERGVDCRRPSCEVQDLAVPQEDEDALSEEFPPDALDEVSA